MNRAARGLCSFALLLSAAVILIVGARPAGAVPVFARKYQTSNLFGVVLHGTDKLRLLDNDNGATIDETTRDYDVWFVQADHVVNPTLQGSVRYEDLRVAEPEIETLQFLNMNVSFLVRANIKALLEYRADLQDSKNYNVAGVVRFAFLRGHCTLSIHG